MNAQSVYTDIKESITGRLESRFVESVILMSLLTMLVVSPVLAQDASEGSDTDAQTLEEVVVEAEKEEEQSLLEEPPRAEAGGMTGEGVQLGPLGNRNNLDVPFNVSSYTEDFTENQIAMDPREVLSSDPSVQNETAKLAHFNGFRIRGLQANYYYDGLPGVFDRGQAWSTEEYSRIEVIKGASAALGSGVSGAGFVGGAVNLVPKRATDDPVTNVNLSYLSGDAYKMHTDIGRRLGSDDQFGIRLNMVSENGDLNIDGQSIDRESVNLAMDYTLDSTRLTADIGYQNRLHSGAHPMFFNNTNTRVPEAPDLDETTGQPWQELDSERLRTVLRAEQDLTDNWTAGVSYSDVDLTEKGPTENTAFFTDDSGNYSHELNLNISATRTYEDWTAYLKGDVQTGGIDHNLSLTGASGEEVNELSDYRKTFIASNLYDPTYVDEQADTHSNLEERPFTNNEERFVSMIDEMTFQDGKYRLVAGAQWIEFGRVAFRGSNPDGDNFPRSKTQDFEHDEIVPISSLSYRLDDGQSLYGSYAQSLERGTKVSSFYSNANEILDPALTEQAEIGYKRDLGDYNYTLSAFQLTKQNRGAAASGEFKVLGDQVHHGLEANLSGKLRDGFRMTGGAMYVDAEQDGGPNDGKVPSAVPELRASLTGEYDVRMGEGNPLTLTGAVQHTGDQYMDAANDFEVDGWTRFDLGLRRSFTDPATGSDLTARLKVENVTDEDYWNNVAFEGLSPGIPRTVKLSFSSKF